LEEEPNQRSRETFSTSQIKGGSKSRLTCFVNGNKSRSTHKAYKAYKPASVTKTKEKRVKGIFFFFNKKKKQAFSKEIYQIKGDLKVGSPYPGVFVLLFGSIRAI
jgi:hypothetical protein